MRPSERMLSGVVFFERTNLFLYIYIFYFGLFLFVQDLTLLTRAWSTPLRTFDRTRISRNAMPMFLLLLLLCGGGQGYVGLRRHTNLMNKYSQHPITHCHHTRARAQKTGITVPARPPALERDLPGRVLPHPCTDGPQRHTPAVPAKPAASRVSLTFLLAASCHRRLTHFPGRPHRVLRSVGVLGWGAWPTQTMSTARWARGPSCRVGPWTRPPPTSLAATS